MSISSIAKGSIIYGISSVLAKLINYLLFPIYISAFSLSEYGLLTRLYALSAFLTILYNFGIESAYTRFNNLQGSFNIFLGIITRHGLLLSVVIMAVSYALSFYINVSYTYILYLTIIAYTDAIISILTNKLRLDGLHFLLVKKRTAHLIINVTINIFFIYIMVNSYYGTKFVFLNTLSKLIFHRNNLLDYVFIANIIANLWLLLSLCKDLQVSFYYSLNLKKDLIEMIFKYTFPIVITGFFYTINEMFSRASLKYLLPNNFYDDTSKDEIVGGFGACYKFALFMILLIKSFNYSIEPFFLTFFHKNNTNISKEYLNNILYIFIVISSIILFSVSINIDIIALIINKSSFKQLIGIVPHLLLGYLFLGIYQNTSIWYRAINKTYYNTIINFLGAILTISINIIFVPLWGYWASVFAMLISYSTMAMVCLYLLYRDQGINFYFFRFSAYITSSYLFALLIRKNLKVGSIPVLFLINSLLTIAFLILVFVIEKDQIKMALSKLNKATSNKGKITN